MSIGIIYLWFGVLKFFNGASPAEELAVNTVNKLTWEILPPSLNFFLLAFWETVSGVLLLVGVGTKPVLRLLILHLVFTFTPLLFYPQLSFGNTAFSFTLLGQYIMKNIVLLSSILVLLQVKENDNWKV
jgi:uncharacterized membrane protein YphA (DoxX/SURF4 family)